jgi:hypothetical protein
VRICEKQIEDMKESDRHESVKSISHAFRQIWDSHEALPNLLWQNARSAEILTTVLFSKPKHMFCFAAELEENINQHLPSGHTWPLPWKFLKTPIS